MKEFNNIKQMKKYYDEENNLFYIEDDIKINFDLVCDWDIDAYDIKAKNITVKNIDAGNIYAIDISARNITASHIIALNIYADDILYYGVCFAYDDIICKSIQSTRENSRHFVLDGKLVVREGGEV